MSGTAPLRCELCAARPGTVPYTVAARMARHAVTLCDRCARSLSWRADDPLLVALDGTTYAGGAVRAIWRRVMERLPVIPIRAPANDDNDPPPI